MSGSRAKKVRRTQRERPAEFINAAAVARSADAVLDVDLSDVEFRSRTDQVVIGLCRAAFAQSKVIASLTAGGMFSAAAPNRRLVLEIALRLHWLQGLPLEVRHKAVDTMLEKDRQDTNRLLKYLSDEGHNADFDASEMNSFPLDDERDGAIHQQATRLQPAVNASMVKPWSIYSAWLGETPLSHASGNLAGKYAPTHDNVHISKGEPDSMDPDLEAHRLIQMQIILMTGQMLTDQGLPDEFAHRLSEAFFSA